MNLKSHDIQHFEQLQKDYINTIAYFRDLVEHMEQWEESLKTNKNFFTATGLKNDIHEIKSQRINKHTEYFILRICDYFRNDYGLSNLTNVIGQEIEDKYAKYNSTEYNNDNLTYQDIVKDVCNKLKINNFDTATIDDLRSRVKQKYKYAWEYERVLISNSKIKITDYGFYVKFNWNDTKVRHISEDTVKEYIDIFSALNYINTGKLEVPEKMQEWLNDVGKDREREMLEFYSTYDIKTLGITSIRLCKNKSLEIKFFNDEEKNKYIRIIKGDF